MMVMVMAMAHSGSTSLNIFFSLTNRSTFFFSNIILPTFKPVLQHLKMENKINTRWIFEKKKWWKISYITAFIYKLYTNEIRVMRNFFQPLTQVYYQMICIYYIGFDIFPDNYIIEYIPINICTLNNHLKIYPS